MRRGVVVIQGARRRPSIPTTARPLPIEPRRQPLTRHLLPPAPVVRLRDPSQPPLPRTALCRPATSHGGAAIAGWGQLAPSAAAAAGAVCRSPGRRPPETPQSCSRVRHGPAEHCAVPGGARSLVHHARLCTASLLDEGRRRCPAAAAGGVAGGARPGGRRRQVLEQGGCDSTRVAPAAPRDIACHLRREHRPHRRPPPPLPAPAEHYNHDLNWTAPFLSSMDVPSARLTVYSKGPSPPKGAHTRAACNARLRTCLAACRPCAPCAAAPAHAEVMHALGDPLTVLPLTVPLTALPLTVPLTALPPLLLSVLPPLPQARSFCPTWDASHTLFCTTLWSGMIHWRMLPCS